MVNHRASVSALTENPFAIKLLYAYQIVTVNLKSKKNNAYPIYPCNSAYETVGKKKISNKNPMIFCTLILLLQSRPLHNESIYERVQNTAG